ncbi:hypothetical protein TKK_0011172 [Trichogramma kaykai]|uniref:Adenylyltransferase and sulfurtransferase MOCS3 homolog n=1 Tax=Trichogramma kaykai TaxID=54128 RepID=A0ABD2WUE1_9HYME
MNEKILLAEIAELKKRLREKEAALIALRQETQILQENGLTNTEIARYSRQVILPSIGVTGQIKIKHASVLIVGAGGLGCPSGLYLAGAGVGRIGIIDYDDVEITNLHRQVLFTSSDIGRPKACAAAEHLNRLNDSIQVVPYKVQLDSSNALNIVKDYDIVLDATDNVATRYLLNDACVLAGKPLVSGSALQFEGQLTVYNFRGGPCFRCIYPDPPPPETVNNCGDSGVIGAVVGTIGVLQALQVINIILDLPGIMSQRLLLFNGINMKFRDLTLRAQNKKCAVCGPNSTIHHLIDYEQFCGSKANDKNPNLKVLEQHERISVVDYNEKISSMPHLLIDVRSAQEFELCHLEHSLNIPFKTLSNNKNLEKLQKEINENHHETKNIYVICRRGNDSQKAVKIMKNFFTNSDIQIRDIIGGIHAWTYNIDTSFPIY